MKLIKTLSLVLILSSSVSAMAREPLAVGETRKYCDFVVFDENIVSEAKILNGLFKGLTPQFDEEADAGGELNVGKDHTDETFNLVALADEESEYIIKVTNKVETGAMTVVLMKGTEVLLTDVSQSSVLGWNKQKLSNGRTYLRTCGSDVGIR